jgi:PEP-CTERM motif
MKSRFLQVMLVGCCWLLLAGTGVAGPIQVILGVSETGDVVFTNTGGNNVTIGFDGNCGEGGANCLAGTAYYGTTVGNYDMWIASGTPTLGTPTGFLYPVNMNGAVIDFASTIGSFTLDGTVDLTSVSGGTQTPTFAGTLLITSSNLPGYGVGQQSGMDFVVNLDGNPSLESVYSGLSGSTSGYLSSGEVSPPPTVPEPGSIALFGSGALAVAGVLRRKLKL